MTRVSLSSLGKDHRAELFRGEGLVLSLVLDLDDWLGVLVDDLEGPVLHVTLDSGLVELASNQPLGIEDGVAGVHGDLVLGRISDETLCVCEGNV